MTLFRQAYDRGMIVVRDREQLLVVEAFTRIWGRSLAGGPHTPSAR
jgi:hypothetical protein